MTETTTEAPAEVTLEFVDAMHEAAFKQLAAFISERNSLVGKANAANGDRMTLTEQITEESTDPKIVKAREARDNAIMQLHALVSPQVDKIMENAKGSIEEIEKSIKDVDQKLKPGVTYFRRLYGDESADHLPAQARLKGVRINSGGGSGRRVRGFNFIINYADEVMEVENAAAVAKFLGDIETSIVQEAFFQAAGVDTSKDAADTVEFALTLTETDEDGNESQETASINAYRTKSE